ncbi:MAG: 1,4-dihydroxy-2-naphthoate polyprenyltransferase [Bacteroidia bacterium]|nr:1,4-dihydroxy-2-naphthoate polyprenyltransferase [Bacteroidia bacterium]
MRAQTHLPVSAPPAISRAQAWLLASRPKTLPAAFAPVMVGTAVAYAEGAFTPLPAVMALLCALLIQIATNLANDYFDYIKGADTEHRIGPVRVVQSGLIPPETVRNVMIGVLAVTFLLGLYLVYLGGWPVLLIGIASLVCAVLYTAGPWPLAYVGLGDVFVFLFFGIVAVTGTHFVQALYWSPDALLASLPIGALSTAILVVNNYRDIDTDKLTGKRTLAVRIGKSATRTQYYVLLAGAFLYPTLHLLAGHSLLYVFPLLTAPLAFYAARIVASQSDGQALNHALAMTGRLLAIYATLLSVAITFG